MEKKTCKTVATGSETVPLKRFNSKKKSKAPQKPRMREKERNTKSPLTGRETRVWKCDRQFVVINVNVQLKGIGCWHNTSDWKLQSSVLWTPVPTSLPHLSPHGSCSLFPPLAADQWAIRTVCRRPENNQEPGVLLCSFIITAEDLCVSRILQPASIHWVSTESGPGAESWINRQEVSHFYHGVWCAQYCIFKSYVFATSIYLC